MKKIRINRARWRAGRNHKTNSCGTGVTSLRNDDGFMCCLGFATQQLSRKNKYHYKNRLSPGALNFVVSPLNERNKDDNRIRSTTFANIAVSINDGFDFTLEEREAMLIKLFEKNNLELEFFGEYLKRSN